MDAGIGRLGGGLIMGGGSPDMFAQAATALDKAWLRG
jgi:hypothetical protein